jgi:glycosyltransferase involved in cell wall biosynthesis
MVRKYYGNKMKVSLILISMNEEDCVPKFLESFKKQTRKPDEIILVDSSTDKTAKLMKPYVDKILFTPPKGCGAAREVGVKNSKGDILVFTDIDAILHPNWLENIVKTFNNPKINVVQGQVLFESLNKEESNMWSKGLPEKGKYLNGCNMAFRRKVLEEFPFDPHINLDDIEMGYRVSKKYIIYGNKNAIIYHYGAGKREYNKLDLWKRGIVYYRGWIELIIKYKNPYWIARMGYNMFYLLYLGKIRFFCFHIVMLFYATYSEVKDNIFKVCNEKIK